VPVAATLKEAVWLRNGLACWLGGDRRATGAALTVRMADCCDASRCIADHTVNCAPLSELVVAGVV